MELNDENLRSELSLQAAIDFYRNRPETETGWDRLREMYTFRYLGYLNFETAPEMMVPSLGFKLGALTGLIKGFLDHMPATRENFYRLNKETKFLDQRDFMREVFKYQLKFSGRHGMRYGLRVGIFSGLYFLNVSTIAMYNNTIGMKEYLASGIITGALWQARVGVNGAVVGAITGAFLSLVAGFLSVKILEYGSIDLATIRYRLHFMRLQEWEKLEKKKAQAFADELLEEAKRELQEQKQ